MESNPNVLLHEILEAEPELILVLRGRFGPVEDVLEEDVGDLHWALVDGGPDAPLEDHLQDLGVRRDLVGGGLQLVDLLLHVLDGHLDRGQHDL